MFKKITSAFVLFLVSASAQAQTLSYPYVKSVGYIIAVLVTLILWAWIVYSSMRKGEHADDEKTKGEVRGNIISGTTFCMIGLIVLIALFSSS